METKRKTGRGTSAVSVKNNKKTKKTGLSFRKKTEKKPAPVRDPEQERTARQNREATRARQRREARAKERSKAPKRPVPAVVYTQPEVLDRRKLVMQLLIVTAIVLALVMGMSVFFKVENIMVSGAHVYSEWKVVEASGLEKGDYLLTFSIPKACGKIIAELPYVDNVRIGIKLPDTVNIVIDELDVTYAIQAIDSSWWLISSEGKVIDQTDGGAAAGYTRIEGVYLDSPVLGEMGVAFERPAEVTSESSEETGEIVGTEPVIITNAERFQAALQILQALEANDIVGQAASLSVEDMYDIQLWYGAQYQVLLGDATNLEYKIACMYSAINDPQMSTGYGVLDISFTIWPDRIGYTPFE